MLSSLRSKCLQVAQEAAAAQQPPMQYALRGAAEPAIPRLMQVASCCQQRKLIDASKCAGTLCLQLLVQGVSCNACAAYITDTIVIAGLAT